MQNRITMLLMALVFSSQVAIAALHEANPYNFIISKDVYKFSELYQIKSPQNETYSGSVKKSAFRIRTNYDLSNKDGWQATGITRVVSLGALYPWATDIDVYDTRGVKIGFIDGDMATLESAKFNLYDYDEDGTATLSGIAYANADFTRFVMMRSVNDPHIVAELNRNYTEKTWSVSVYYPEQIDDRLIRIFAGFVIDFQDKFLTPNDESTK